MRMMLGRSAMAEVTYSDIANATIPTAQRLRMFQFSWSDCHLKKPPKAEQSTSCNISQGKDNNSRQPPFVIGVKLSVWVPPDRITHVEDAPWWVRVPWPSIAGRLAYKRRQENQDSTSTVVGNKTSRMTTPSHCIPSAHDSICISPGQRHKSGTGSPPRRPARQDS